MSVLSKVNNVYSPLESLFYDYVIAPSSLKLKLNYLKPYLQNLSSGDRVLDVGCGGGQVIARLAKDFPHLNFYGIDNSPEQIARAKTVVSRLSDQCQVQIGSALSLPYADEMFEFVFSIAAIKHWPKKAVGISEMLRVSKPSAHLLVTELDKLSGDERIREFMLSWRCPQFLVLPFVKNYREAIIRKSISRSELLQIMDDMQLRIVESGDIQGSPSFFIHAQKIQLSK